MALPLIDAVTGVPDPAYWQSVPPGSSEAVVGRGHVGPSQHKGPLSEQGGPATVFVAAFNSAIIPQPGRLSRAGAGKNLFARSTLWHLDGERATLIDEGERLRLVWLRHGRRQGRRALPTPMAAAAADAQD